MVGLWAIEFAETFFAGHVLPGAFEGAHWMIEKSNVLIMLYLWCSANSISVPYFRLTGVGKLRIYVPESSLGVTLTMNSFQSNVEAVSGENFVEIY